MSIVVGHKVIIYTGKCRANASYLEGHPASYFAPVAAVPLLAGRAGGQILYGGTGEGDDLALCASSHATPGRIRPYGTMSWRNIPGAIRLFEAGNTIYGLDVRNLLGRYVLCAFFPTDNEFSFATINSGGAITEVAYVTPAGDLWAAGNVSALSFTDRTPAFQGDALAALADIAADKDGKIDHATLPEFARHTRKVPIYEEREAKQDVNGKKREETERVQVGEEEVQERNIGNMVSIHTVAFQQLIGELKKRDEIIEKLAARLEKLENAANGREG